MLSWVEHKKRFITLDPVFLVTTFITSYSVNQDEMPQIVCSNCLGNITKRVATLRYCTYYFQNTTCGTEGPMNLRFSIVVFCGCIFLVFRRTPGYYSPALDYEVGQGVDFTFGANLFSESWACRQHVTCGLPVLLTSRV